MSGAAWNVILSASDKSIPAPVGSESVSGNFSIREPLIYAAALRYARSGEVAYRNKARDAIDVSIDTDLLVTNTDQSLAAARNIGMLVLAADLIDLPAYAPTIDERFRTWIAACRTRAYNPRSIWENTRYMGCNNWGGLSHITIAAINVYIDDFTGPNGLNAQYTRFKGTLGDRASFADIGNDDIDQAPWTNGRARIYTTPAIEAAPVPINPLGTTVNDSNGTPRDMSGCLIADQARTDEFLGRAATAPLLWPPPIHYVYPIGGAHDLTCAAEIFYRAGKTGVWDFQDKALDRAHDFLKRIWEASGRTAWYQPGPGVPTSTMHPGIRGMGQLANYRYGAGRYPVYVDDASNLRPATAPPFCEYTHAGYVGYSTSVPPPPPPPPAAERATVYKSSFVGATVIGNQQPAVITIPFQPKLIKLIAEPIPTGDTFDDDARLSIGMAASSSQQVCCAISANPLKKVHSTTGKCIQLIHSDGTVYDADFVSFDSVGGGNWKFTIHWNTAPAVGWTIHVVAIGDDAITNVKVGSFTAPTAVGAFSVSGIGFAGDAAHFLLPGLSASTTARFTYGEGFACEEAGAGTISQAFNYVQQFADGSRSRIQEQGACLYGPLPDTTHAQDHRANLTGFGADSLDFNNSDATAQGAGNVPILYAVIKGGSHSVQLVTQRGGVGSKLYADPFTPNGVILSSVGRTHLDGVDLNNRIDYMIGLTDLVRQGSLYIGGTAPTGTPAGGGKRNSFENGLADGTALTPTNSDDGGAGDAASAVNSVNVTVSTEHPANGTRGMKVAAAGTAIYATWSAVNPDALPVVMGRFYFRIPAGTVVGVNMKALRSVAAATIGTIAFDSTLKPRMLNSTGGVIGSLGTALSVDTDYRCEYRLTIDEATGANGELIGTIYAGNSTTPLTTFGGTSGVLGTSVLDLVRLGVNNNITATMYYDGLVAGANAYPGPGPDVVTATDYRARWSQQRVWEDSDAADILSASAQIGPEQIGGWQADWLTANPTMREAIAWTISDDPQAPSLVSAPAVSGLLQVGQTLAAVPGVYDGLLPMARSYQWLRCDATGGSCVVIPAAVAESYLLTDSDYTHTIKVRETVTNAVGSLTADSGFVGPLLAPAPPPDTPPDPGDPGDTPSIIVVATTPLRHLRNRLRVCAIEPALFSDTRILELFNEGYVDACKRSKCLRALATVAGGVGSVALPTDFAAIISVFNNGRELPPLPPDVALTRHYSGYETTGSTISFDEGTTGNVYLLYARKPEPFTTIDDIPDPGFPPEFYELLFHYACWRRYAVAGGAGRIGQARWNRDQFDRGIRGLRRQANLVPGENRFVHVLETGPSRVRKFRVGADVDGG